GRLPTPALAVAARARGARLRAGADPGHGRFDPGEPARADVRRRRGGGACVCLATPQGRQACAGTGPADTAPRCLRVLERAQPRVVARPSSRGDRTARLLPALRAPRRRACTAPLATGMVRGDLG